MSLIGSIIEKLNELGHKTIDEAFYRRVDVWKSWYIGNVKDFHRYRMKTGRNIVNCKRYSLGMGKKISEDWANLLMNEKVSITLGGQKEQNFVDDIFSKNSFDVKINEMQEIKFALGTTAYIPRVMGMEARSGEAIAGSAKNIAIDYVTVEHIYPLAWQNGIITECAFDSLVTVNGEEYVYLQIHTINPKGFYIIENKIYHKVGESLTEVELTDVKGYENIPKIIETRSDKRQFVIDRPNIANNLDYSVPLGISVYANAIDAMQGVDIAYDAFVSDFITGKRRMFISPAATEYIDGEPAFDDNDIALYVLPEDVSGENKPIQSTGGSYAVDSTTSGVQSALSYLSSKCGFGENYYRFDNGSIATATQVISENSTMFRTVKKHEIILEDVLIELCRIILRLGNSAMNAGLNEDAEIIINFDDSIIEDKQTKFSQTLQLLSAGLINDYEARAILVNEDKETAKARLPKMEDMTDEEEKEIE